MEVNTYSVEEFNHTAEVTEGLYSFSNQNNEEKKDKKRRLRRAALWFAITGATVIALCMIAIAITIGILSTGNSNLCT